MLLRPLNLGLRVMSTTAETGPIAASISRKIQDALQPVTLKVVNESHKHAGHAGNPSGAADAETHFKVEVVSAAFEGKSLVARHRMIYQLLQHEIDVERVHALALKTKTPQEQGAR